jgi:hypothetical protein
LSSRAKPRDLQFRGPLLETRNTILKQNCHLDRTRISCHAALETTACAAFVKESSMKCANATKFHGKSGGASRSGEICGFVLLLTQTLKPS